VNSTIMRRIEVATDYQPLSETPLVGSFEISAVPTNAATVFFRGDDGSDVPWMPGEYHAVYRVDLSRILVKGTPGDQVTVIGGTW
jgi:hypothetical protein